MLFLFSFVFVFLFFSLNAVFLPPPLLLFSFLFLTCPPSGFIMSSSCWSITWTYHRTDRTSKQKPCPVGTLLAPWAHVDLGFVFSFLSFLSVDFLPVLSFVDPFFALLFSPLFGVYTYTGYVPGVISSQVIRDGILRAVVATGAWAKSKHGMYVSDTWKCGSLSFIFTHPPEDV